MTGLHLLDQVIGCEYPSFATDDEVHAFEEIPYADRIAAASTYDAIRIGAAYRPDAPAIQYLPNADPADNPIVITHGGFVMRVTQAANMFHALGVGSHDVVSFLLPLLPEAFITLFGAEAAGIANPVRSAAGAVSDHRDSGSRAHERIGCARPHVRHQHLGES